MGQFSDLKPTIGHFWSVAPANKRGAVPFLLTYCIIAKLSLSLWKDLKNKSAMKGNHLLLTAATERIVLSGNDTVRYWYSAAGIKLRENTTDYSGSLVIKNGLLDKLLVPTGYVAANGNITSNGQYVYFVKDHLGSVRATVAQNGTVLERYWYGPYGDDVPAPGQTTVQTGTTDNPYRFSGKERTLADYDFGARRYLPFRVPRWTSMDPMAEKYFSISPYAYCAADPVNLVDPEGEDLYIKGSFSTNVLSFLTDFFNKRDCSLEINEITGQITYSLKNTEKELSPEASRIKEIIDANDISVTLNVISDPDSESTIIGSFEGNKIDLDNNGNVIKVDALQTINYYDLETLVRASEGPYSKINKEEISKFVLHEVTEAFEGAKTSKAMKHSALKNGIYQMMAHNNAYPQPNLKNTGDGYYVTGSKGKDVLVRKIRR